MVRQHHQLEFERVNLSKLLGDGEGQRSLACCGPWVTESDTTQRLNNNISDEER